MNMKIRTKLSFILCGGVIAVGLLAFWAFSVSYAPIARCTDDSGKLIDKNVSENISELFRLVRTHIDKGVDVKIGSFTCPAGTGNYSITGVGFQPRYFDFTVSQTNSSDYITFGVGSMDYNGNQHAATIRRKALDGAIDVRNMIVTNRCLLAVDKDASYLVSASFISMNSDGGTINFLDINTDFTILWKAVR